MNLFPCFQFHWFRFISINISCLLVFIIFGSSFISFLRKKHRLLTWELSFSLKINVFMVYLFLSFDVQPVSLFLKWFFLRMTHVGSFLKIHYISLSFNGIFRLFVFKVITDFLGLNLPCYYLYSFHVFSFSFIFLHALLWTTWTLFRISCYFIVFLCILFRILLLVVALSITIYRCNLLQSTYWQWHFTILSEILNLCFHLGKFTLPHFKYDCVHYLHTLYTTSYGVIILVSTFKCDLKKIIKKI